LNGEKRDEALNAFPKRRRNQEAPIGVNAFVALDSPFVSNWLCHYNYSVSDSSSLIAKSIKNRA